MFSDSGTNLLVVAVFLVIIVKMTWHHIASAGTVEFNRGKGEKKSQQ